MIYTFDAIFQEVGQALSASFEQIVEIEVYPELQDNKTVTPQAYNEVLVTPDGEYYGLASVIVERIPYAERDNLLGGKTIIIA